MSEIPEVTLTAPQIYREPEFIDPNDLERLCIDTLFAKAVCRYSTGVKRKIRLGRCHGEEFHLIKDWFALIPNAEARAFAAWLLELAERDWDATFNREYDLNEYAPGD